MIDRKIIVTQSTKELVTASAFLQILLPDLHELMTIHQTALSGGDAA